MSWITKAGILTTLLTLVELGVIPNNQNGFYCDDPSISFQFMGDTITITTLLTGTFLLPIFFTLAIEWALLHWHSIQGSSNESDEDEEDDSGEGMIESDGKALSKIQPCGLQQPSTKSQKAKVALASMWPWYKEFLLGLGVNFLIMDLTKVLVGEPRPHFLDTCRPDLAKNCTSGYIPHYKCTNTWDNIWEVRDATKSFPSGHASISVYTALFMMWFIQKRIPGRPTFLLIPFLHCLWITWAIVCSITRILDHRHHWWDVLGGTVLGIGVTVFTVRTQCKHAQVGLVHSEDAYLLPKGIQRGRKAQQVPGSVVRGEGSRGLHERNQWMRRLLSSSSSAGAPEERELKDVVLP